VADTIVLSKMALAGNLDELRSQLKTLNPLARVISAEQPDLSAQDLFDTGAYDPAARSIDVARWLSEFIR
jgi:G3E family GTPase